MSNELKLKGTLVEVLKVDKGTSKAGKDWQKQEFIIETDDKFPKKVCFTLFGDKTALLEGIGVGNTVDVFFNLESRDFNGKWFHSINCWKLEAQPTSGLTTASGTQPNQQLPTDDDKTDLPF